MNVVEKREKKTGGVGNGKIDCLPLSVKQFSDLFGYHVSRQSEQ